MHTCRERELKYSLDSTRIGNVGRYINHSCNVRPYTSVTCAKSLCGRPNLKAAGQHPLHHLHANFSAENKVLEEMLSGSGSGL